ncbi:AAA family ATPase [Nocardioides nanhaiensis]|uniref:AAA family ATPase n=1 Tax=Nocardioides nanhaiensis TaxID=1476871 RepID=A0ABP8WZV3_9ACTN
MNKDYFEVTEADIEKMFGAPVPAEGTVDRKLAEIAVRQKVRDAEAISQKVYGLRQSHEAKREFSQELALEEFEAPNVEFLTLAEQLAAPEVPQEYLIDGLLIEGGNMLLAAQKKSGKSTLMMNMMKSLCDGDPFLGQFAVRPPDGRVAWWDYELDQNYATNMLRKMNIRTPERASALHLRGFSTPLIAPAVQDWAVEWLTRRQVKVWIIDPFGAVFTGEENSNDDVREWHKAVDLIKRRAGVSEVVVVTHTGHGEAEEGFERTRGASRLGDWADNTWAWSGSGLANEREGVPATQRWLIAAQSRGVEMQKWTVDCDTTDWSLRVVGQGGRVEATKTRIQSAILDVLRTSTEPVSGKAISNAVTGKDETIRKQLAGLVESGVLTVQENLHGRGSWYSIPDIVR